MLQKKSLVSVENVVTSTSVDQKLDLIQITKRFLVTEYCPELVLRLKSLITTTLIFRIRNRVCIGAKKESDVYLSVDNLNTLLEEKDLIIYEQ